MKQPAAMRAGMRAIFAAFWPLPLILIMAMAMPASAKSTKYTAKQIGAEKACRNDDPAMPLAKCMKDFGDRFCQEKGHKTHIMVNWSSDQPGYSSPDMIYCK